MALFLDSPLPDNARAGVCRGGAEDKRGRRPAVQSEIRHLFLPSSLSRGLFVGLESSAKGSS